MGALYEGVQMSPFGSSSRCKYIYIKALPKMLIPSISHEHLRPNEPLGRCSFPHPMHAFDKATMSQADTRAKRPKVLIVSTIIQENCK